MANPAALPHVVGNAFVNQYYNVLHQSPQVVHRFYTDASSLTRAEPCPDGLVDTVFGQNGIHQKVMSLDYGDIKAEIKTIDSQDSLTGSVLVMVTGSLSNKSNGKRDFVQTFFLAPQERGYFVLNDIFRYLDEASPVIKSPYAMANGIAEPPLAPLPADSGIDSNAYQARENATSVADDDVAVEEVCNVPTAAASTTPAAVEDDVAAEEMAQNGMCSEVDDQSSSLAAVDATSNHDEGQGEPKKSYASIVLRMKDASGMPLPMQSSPVKSSPLTVAERSSPQIVAVAVPTLPPVVDTLEEPPTPTETDADCKSIYIKGLPLAITVPQLEEEFSRFGAVKSGCTNVKKQQNICYAFMEFEDSNGAHAALEASPFQIGGKNVHVEEKRPMNSRGYRGRGRGRSDGSGGRGRGYYSGGGRGRGGYSDMSTSSSPSGRGRGSVGMRAYSAANGPSNNINNSNNNSNSINYNSGEDANNSGNIPSSNTNNNNNRSRRQQHFSRISRSNAPAVTAV